MRKLQAAAKDVVACTFSVYGYWDGIVTSILEMGTLSATGLKVHVHHICGGCTIVTVI